MPKTKLSAAYRDFGRKKKTFASGLTAIRQLEQEQQFKSKKLGLEQQQTQDFFTHTGQLIGLAGTGVSMYGEYQEGQKALESVGRAEFEEIEAKRVDESVDSELGSYEARSWDELQPEEKKIFMPEKDYGFDTTTRWGKWGKTFADISELTGDWDPDYVLGTGKSIKMSHMKSLYDLSQVQDIAKEYGIDLYKNDKNTGDGSKSLKSVQETYSEAADETVKTETPGKWDLSKDKYFKDLAEKSTMKRWVSDLFKNLKVGSESELDIDKVKTSGRAMGDLPSSWEDPGLSEFDKMEQLVRSGDLDTPYGSITDPGGPGQGYEIGSPQYNEAMIESGGQFGSGMDLPTDLNKKKLDEKNWMNTY